MAMFTRTLKSYEHMVTVADRSTREFIVLVVRTEENKAKEISEAVKAKNENYILISVDGTTVKKQRVKISLDKLIENADEIEDIENEEGDAE